MYKIIDVDVVVLNIAIGFPPAANVFLDSLYGTFRFLVIWKKDNF